MAHCQEPHLPSSQDTKTSAHADPAKKLRPPKGWAVSHLLVRSQQQPAPVQVTSMSRCPPPARPLQGSSFPRLRAPRTLSWHGSRGPTSATPLPSKPLLQELRTEGTLSVPSADTTLAPQDTCRSRARLSLGNPLPCLPTSLNGCHGEKAMSPFHPDQGQDDGLLGPRRSL